MDMLSARVTDPHLIPLWITNPQGQMLLLVSVVVSISSGISHVFLSSGICNPRGNHCGYAIRAGRRPAVNSPVDCKSTGTKLSFPLSQIKSQCPRGFVIPEVVICGYAIRAGHRPAVNHPVDCKSTGTHKPTLKTSRHVQHLVYSL